MKTIVTRTLYPKEEETSNCFKNMIKINDQPWVSLQTLRKTNDPFKICTLESVPRLARDESYAKDLLEAWNKDYTNNEEDTTTSSGRSKLDSYGSIFPYNGSKGEKYSGYLVVPQHLHQRNFEVKNKVPVIIMFHTGAGPQDIFIRYKADKLAREDIWGDDGCIIFIVDIIQDNIGWSWGDRKRYYEMRTKLLSVEERDGIKKRYLMQDTLSSIMDVVRSIDKADVNRVAAMGFCLGGHPIMELGRMQYDEIIALVSYHGLFDGITTSGIMIDPKDETKASSWNNKPREVLICNGKNDPWVTDDDLDAAQEQFEQVGYHVKVLNFENALHNFSNPRTKYDDADATQFGYNENADMISWNETIQLFGKIFFN